MYRVDLYARVRRACRIEGMSSREASRVFGVDRKTVRKMLSFSVPPGYRRSTPPRRPKLDPFTGVIDRILEDAGSRRELIKARSSTTFSALSSSRCPPAENVGAIIPH